MTGRSTRFVGTTGEYYVAYQLASRGLHAAVTQGNAPNVDILVASPDGARHLSLQVKTQRNAYRRTRYGMKSVCEWMISGVQRGSWASNLWFAFVDLQENSEEIVEPRVFFVPSRWVGTWIKEDDSMKVYMLRHELWPECQDRWDRIEDFLSEAKRPREKAQAWSEARPPKEAERW